MVQASRGSVPGFQTFIESIGAGRGTPSTVVLTADESMETDTCLNERVLIIEPAISVYTKLTEWNMYLDSITVVSSKLDYLTFICYYHVFSCDF